MPLNMSVTQHNAATKNKGTADMRLAVMDIVKIMTTFSPGLFIPFQRLSASEPSMELISVEYSCFHKTNSDIDLTGSLYSVVISSAV